MSFLSPDPLRGLTLGMAWLRKLVTPASGRRCVPILMYHSIARDEDSRSPGHYRMTTHPEVFRRQLGFLADAGYRGVSLEEGATFLGGAAQGRPTVILTFDDGFLDFRDNAFPILRSYGFGASVFLPTSFVREPRVKFEGRDCLSWSDVLELRGEGVRFGSHTVTHPVLHREPWERVQEELVASKSELEFHLQEPITTFCHPFAYPQADAYYCARLRELLLAAGYTTASTTRLGRSRPGDDLLALKRLPVSSLDDPTFLRAKLEGGIDWLAIPQYCSSWFRHRPRRQ